MKTKSKKLPDVVKIWQILFIIENEDKGDLNVGQVSLSFS